MFWSAIARGEKSTLLFEDRQDAVDDEDAFKMLVKSSQDTNMKLTAVAAWLINEVRASLSTLPPTSGPGAR